MKNYQTLNSNKLIKPMYLHYECICVCIYYITYLNIYSFNLKFHFRDNQMHNSY